MTREGIWSSRCGRTRDLSEMRLSKNYGELRCRGGRDVWRVRVHGKERDGEKWTGKSAKVVSVPPLECSWYGTASGRVVVIQKSCPVLEWCFAGFEPENVEDDEAVPVCVRFFWRCGEGSKEGSHLPVAICCYLPFGKKAERRRRGLVLGMRKCLWTQTGCTRTNDVLGMLGGEGLETQDMVFLLLGLAWTKHLAKRVDNLCCGFIQCFSSLNGGISGRIVWR